MLPGGIHDEILQITVREFAEETPLRITERSPVRNENRTSSVISERNPGEISKVFVFREIAGKKSCRNSEKKIGRVFDFTLKEIS